MLCIGDLIKQYEDNYKLDNQVKEQKILYKTKEVCKKYPALTPYILDKAVKEKKLSYVKIGNTNYFNSMEIENFLNFINEDV